MTLDPWTLGFQTVNVVVLVWLLQHFFWRPVAAMITERRSTTETALAEAKAAQDKATVALDDVARTRAGFASERDAILVAARADAAKASAATLEDVAKKAVAEAAIGKVAIEKAREDAETAWRDGASDLALDIAGRLAGRLTGEAVRAVFLDGLLASIRSLPEAARRATAVGGAALEAVTATPLDRAGQDRCSALIGEAFGATPTIAFRTDPSLIAGFEIHGPHFNVENSWRADLDRIGKAMRHAANV